MAAVTGMGRADRLAEAELYERHSSRIFGYCLTRLGAREEAEDATQLTFLHAVRSLRRGVVPAAESAWLFGIARNVCLSRWASAARRRRVEAACDPSELERLGSGHEHSRDELIGLERALERLPEQQRRAVLLRDWRGLSYEEVAAQLGVSHAAVETLIFRGRAALAEHLGEQSAEPRRRRHSVGAFWSVVDAIKGAFAGAAAGAKVAAAVGAAVAVSGGGIALGTTLTREPVAKPAPSSAVAARPPRVAGPHPVAVRSRPSAPARPRRAQAAAPASGTRAVDPVVIASAPGDTGVLVSPSQGDVSVPGTAAPVESAPAAGASPDAASPDAASPAPAVDAPAADVPVLETPALPAAAPPSTDGVIAATEPVTAVVTETLASAPALPAVPSLPVPVAVPVPTEPLPVPTVPAVPAPKLPPLLP